MIIMPISQINTKKIVIIFSIVSRFHYSWLIKGFCFSNDTLDVQLLSIDIKELPTLSISNVVCHIGKSIDESKKGIVPLEFQFLLRDISGPENIEITFNFNDNIQVLVTLRDAVESVEPENNEIGVQFANYLVKPEVKCLLDVGGRARSGILHSLKYADKKVTVLDILPGQGVDVVGDAHEMSKVLPNNHFDAIRCSAVFEHIIMPWKVAVEMNRVMRVGALALISTHQTIGMHDLPWDYYRYSNTAWHGIFNKHTGFKVVDTKLSNLMFIIPFRWKDRYMQVEKTAGYESSVVLVEKIGKSTVDWPISTKDVVQDFYPA
jgi:hypothetical protein